MKLGMSQCHCPGTPVPEPWDAAYCPWCPSSRAVQGRWCPCAGPSVRAAGDTVQALPTAPWMGMAVAALLAAAPGEEAVPGPGAGSVPRGMAAGGHGKGRGGFGREPCTLPSRQGWQSLLAPGDNSDSSCHPTLSRPSMQGHGTARVWVTPSLAVEAGSGSQHPLNGARVKEQVLPCMDIHLGMLVGVLLLFPEVQGAQLSSTHSSVTAGDLATGFYPAISSHFAATSAPSLSCTANALLSCSSGYHLELLCL